MYQYPYGDTQQLNLDWILTKIKELEAGSGNINMEDVANALISATYNSVTQYRRYDYCYLNGKLYRCLSDTTGAFNPADWQEVLIGDDIPILTRLINTVDASLTSLQTTVGNQGNAITALQNAVGDLDSDDIDNASSDVSGDTVTDALDNLNDAITIGTLLNGMPQTAMRIPANADMNSYTTAGTYYIYSDADAATIANTPRSASGTIYVINRSNGNYKAQIYIPTSSLYVYFVRNYNNGSWTNWETVLNTNKNIANIEYSSIASQNYAAGDWIITDSGSLYKVILPINVGESIVLGTNISSLPINVSGMIAQLSQNVEFGEWTPHIYDLNTYLRATPHSGIYFHVGKLWALAYETYDGGTACDLSGITTMLQIRNFPVNGINIIGGVFDIDQVATVNNHYIQAAIENRIYFRPNVLSTAFTDATNVKMSFIVFGIKP